MKASDTKGAIIAHRNDGMGARVIAMLNAIRVARDYGVPYYVGWTTHGRTREEVRDPSFIFDPDYIAERFFQVEIMSEIRDDLIDLSTVDSGSWSEAKFRKALSKGKSFMSGAAMGVIVLPWENEADVTARLPACIDAFEFSNPVQEMVSKIVEVFAGKTLTAYHIRRGDIILDPITSNKLWPNKFIPREFYEQHLDVTLRDPNAQVLCFSDTPIEVERLKAKDPDRVQGFKDLLGDREFTTGARDFLELYAMSRCQQIFGPPSSAFSQTAMVVGGSSLDAVQDALSEDDQSAAMDRMTERLEEKSDLFLNMGDVGQCLHFLIEHQIAKGNSNRAKRIIRTYMEDGLDKSFAYQLLCELSVTAGELYYSERVRDLAYARPVYVDDSMAYVNCYSGINQLVNGNWDTAHQRIQSAVWFRPLEPMIHGVQNIALTAGVLTPGNFYPFDVDMTRQKGSVFPNGKKALGELNQFTPKGHPEGDRIKFHPWDLTVRDWRMCMGKRLNRAFSNKSKIIKNIQMLERSFSKKEGSAALTSAIGVLQRGMGELDAALASQRLAIEMAPEVAIYRKRMSDVLFETDNDQTALMQLEKAAEMHGEHPAYMAEMAQRFWKVKRRDECAKLHDRLFEMDHNYVEIHLMNADMLRRDKTRIEDALVAINRSLDLAHGSQRLMSQKGKILMLLDRADEARDLYGNIVDWGQGTEHTHVEILRQFRALGREDIAEDLTARSIYDFELVKEMAGD